MSTHELEFDDLPGHLTLLDHADCDNWPGASVELDVVFHPAEPDVGVFEAQPEIVGETYWLGSVSYRDETEFVKALYAAIGDQIEESEQCLLEMIRSRIENEELSE